MYRTARRNTSELLEANEGGELGRAIDWFIMILIAVNVAAVMLQTVDPVGTDYAEYFYLFEAFSVAIFTVEYVGRVWSAVEYDGYDDPVTGRIEFAGRPLLVIDFLAIVPFYLTGLGVASDLRFLRALRLIRILRLLKLARYSESLQAFGFVLREKKPDLLITLFANVILLVIASSAMYHVESHAQPDAFASIPETMWWGIATLTTVGYGDVTPVTPLGQFLGAITAILGIGLFALPASILAAGFIEATGSGRHECPECGAEIDPEEY